jgi:DeoR/GlpR family transcriptional regulator of sugar metabolism
MKSERLSELLHLVKEKKFINTTDAIKLTGKSLPTINRDFNSLAKNKMIERTVGGIYWKSGDYENYSYADSEKAYLEEKRIIAKSAYSFVENEDIVILNPGVTTFELSKIISESELNNTIITNSLKILNHYCSINNRNIISLGGELETRNFAFSGKIANEAMRSLMGTKAFIGIYGIDIERGFTLPTFAEAELVSIMIKKSKKTIILADNSKFGKISLYNVDDIIDYIDVIITDAKTDKKYINYFKQKNIEMVIAEYHK